jgi:hypothetical protein
MVVLVAALHLRVLAIQVAVMELPIKVLLEEELLTQKESVAVLAAAVLLRLGNPLQLPEQNLEAMVEMVLRHLLQVRL